jgi:7,8-dihydro-6-hydroxymethylpterin-pyrophosphokinase
LRNRTVTRAVKGDQVGNLVADVDILLWGDQDEAVDKTGVVIDGPDMDSDTSTYLKDTAVWESVILGQ